MSGQGAPAPGSRSSWPTVRLVAEREVVTRMRTKAYRLTTAAMVLAVIALIVLFKVIGPGDQTITVAVAPAMSALAQPLEDAGEHSGTTIKTQTADDPQTARQQVRDGDVDAYLTGTPTAPRVVVHREAPDGLAVALTLLARQQALSSQVTSLGGDPAKVSAAVAGAAVPVSALEPPDPNQGQRIVLGVVVGLLIYLSLMLYGQQVAQGVVEEKTSRVVELLLATIRPWQLMAGKVTGIGIAGLLQLFLVAVVGTVAAVWSGVLDLNVAVTVGSVVWAVVWFVVGFAMYALLFAAAGALVSRQEEVGSVTFPMMTLIIVPYVVGISVLPTDPENTLATILSLVPLTAPVLMPWRIAMGVAPAWQAWLALGLTLALIPVLVWLAGRIYRNSVLRTGTRVNLRDALRGG